MKKLVFLGIGSRIMMDDGVGIYLAEDLKPLLTDTGIEFVTGETDIDFCLSKISGADGVIIADAFLSGKNPGAITVLPLSDLNKSDNSTGFSLHGMHFLDVMQNLNCRTDGFFIGIEPYEINYGFSMSDMLQSCYPDILKSIYNFTNQYIQLSCSI